MNFKTLYSGISGSYETANHFMTFGMDVLWRRTLVKMAVAHGGARWLDACSGTGETAVMLGTSAPLSTCVTAADFTREMLGELKKKVFADTVDVLAGDTCRLPFAERTFDVVTMTFAARNLRSSPPGLEGAFREIFRVLKPGGLFLNLETSQPHAGWIRAFFHAYAHLLATTAGHWISHRPEGYRYLSRSIQRFHDAASLAEMLRDKGFSDVGYRRLFLGVAAIHWGYKLET